jgi:hypothetical protein
MEEKNSKEWWATISDINLEEMIELCIYHNVLKVDLLFGKLTFFELIDEKLRRNEIY